MTFMFINQPPDKTEIKSGSIGTSYVAVFEKKKEIDDYPDIGIFAGVSISNNSADELEISYGRTGDDEKTDTIDPLANLELTSTPGKILMRTLGGGESNYTIYYDYYSKTLLNEIKSFNYEMQKEVIMDAIKEISPMIVHKETVIIDDKSENIFQKMMERLRGGK